LKTVFGLSLKPAIKPSKPAKPLFTANPLIAPFAAGVA